MSPSESQQPEPDHEVTEPGQGPSWLRIGLTLAASAGVLLVALAVVGVIYWTEPEAQRETAVKRTAMLVQTAPVERGTYTPVFQALGTVRADQDVQLQPQVSGRVVTVAETFVPGRVVQQGQVLVQLDRADLSNRLAQQRSALAQAESDLELELGRQAVARVEREQIDGPVSPAQDALILREPQLASTRARVDAAQAAVRQAELELARTRVQAPFDALVLTRQASPGAQVSPGTALGRLVGVERFWVELTLPVSRLRFLPDPASGESLVRVHDRAAWAPGIHREGRLVSLVRQVDDATRMARLLVAVDDPLALDPATGGEPLMAGAYVQAQVLGEPLRDVVRLPRAHLRKGDTVWQMVDDKLAIRQVQVIVQDADHAYIADGLAPEAPVVTTDLATVTDGAPLRTRSDSAATDGEGG